MLAIHVSSGHFSVAWLQHCREMNIPYKEVDCFSSDIIDQLKGCDALLWHWEHHDYRAALFARQLVASVEKMGLLVFPNSATAWHYDDKIGQKYLLEAVGVPLVASHVFYGKERALQWVSKTDFPKVWKLRGGAGSQNVRLVRNREAARRIVKRSFGFGWPNSRFHALRDRLWQFRRSKSLVTFIGIGRGIARAIIPHENNARGARQRDYVYFQDFVPENSYDIRVVVIGSRAFAIKRMVRAGDFRASGSGSLVYEAAQIPDACLRIAFDVTARLHSQSCAFDFVRDDSGWLIVEISYAFSADAYRQCPGYWDRSLHWHDEPVMPERFMLEDLLHTLQLDCTFRE